jgi:hypothetical protein
MIPEHLIETLQQLNRAEKLRIVQLLVEQLAQEESLLTAAEYEVWSPYDAPGAAAILTQMLEEDRQKNDQQ